MSEKKEDSFVKEAVRFVRDTAISVLVITLCFEYVVRPVKVIGSSMYPTLHDRYFGFANVLGYKLGGVKRFDVVIIYLKESKEYIVKRVIGLPNETISYQDGVLYVNGEAMEEPFLDTDYVASYGKNFMSDVGEITLGSDEYYCLGDNRPHSSDSRYYGPFHKSQILAKGVVNIWPLNDMGVHTW